MAITGFDTLLASLGTAEQRSWMKVCPNFVSGAFYSLWSVPGTPGAAPTPSPGLAGDIPTATSPGAFPFAEAAAGNTRYLSQFSTCGASAGTVMLYDRLWHNSGLSLGVTTAQTINSVALTRETSGAGVELWFQITTALGSASPIVTVTYTNQDGVTGRTATMAGYTNSSNNPHRLYPFVLQAGDTGVRSIETYQQSTTWPSGAAGLVLRKRLTTSYILLNNVGTVQDAISGGMLQITPAAALELCFLSSGSGGTFTYFGNIQVAQG